MCRATDQTVQRNSFLLNLAMSDLCLGKRGERGEGSDTNCCSNDLSQFSWVARLPFYLLASLPGPSHTSQYYVRSSITITNDIITLQYYGNISTYYMFL